MTLAVFLLPHVLDEPEVQPFLSDRMSVDTGDLMVRLRNGEDHRRIFSSEQLETLSDFLHGELGIANILSVAWAIPDNGEIAVFTHRGRYLTVSEGELIGPSDGPSLISPPDETSGIHIQADGGNAPAMDAVASLLKKRNGERLVYNGNQKVCLDGKLLSIPDISCCSDCPDEPDCRHVFGVIDDSSSVLLGGYLLDKQIALGNLLVQAFEALDKDSQPDRSSENDRNSRYISRLLDVFRKKNSGGLNRVIRNENFFRLTRNLIEETCETILHPDESALKGFDIHPVCFMSENVVEDFERVKAALLSELGQDGDLDGPNEFGIIA